MRRVFVALWVGGLAAGAALAQQPPNEFQPRVGQPGKDVVWVPTPYALVEKMLDLAEVTPQDFVVDLGSGDGRNVIAAAGRRARALGVEYNPDMVDLSRREAAKAGVSDRASFVQGDMFEFDFSQATVMALFLLPSNMDRLRPKFLELAPGTRIVANTFGIDGWEPDVTERIEDTECSNWCTALLWIVPAKVAGTWQLPQGTLTLQQSYQVLSGTFASPGGAALTTNGRMHGDQISFSAGGAEYTGRVNGDTMRGTVSVSGRQESWTATRAPR